MSEKEELPSHHGADENTTRTYPNETIRLLCERTSLRNFADRPVPENILDLILEAGIHAPTGGNLQPYSIIKSESREVARKMAHLCGDQNFIADAPVNLLFCMDYHRLRRWAEFEIAPFTATSAFPHFWIGFQDTIIAAQNICTAADALGLGSVYIGTVVDRFREFRDLFELPRGVFPVVLLCLGYPREKPPVKKKLGIEIVVHDEKYREIDDDSLRAAFQAKYPALKVQITEDRLDKIASVCRRVHGEAFARQCLDRIRENGYINPVQRYFGMHYCADEMPEGNDTFLEIFEESGFDWFKRYEFPHQNEA